MYEGQLAEAEKLERQVIAVQARLLGPEHMDTAASKYNLALVEVHRGKTNEALQLLREAVEHGLSPSDCGALEKDPDLKPLHGDPRFQPIVAEAKQCGTPAQQSN
jgi:hypothetical protein